MIYFIFGGSASGKSEYAEALAVKCAEGRRLLYIATMRSEGEEAAARIEKHRRQRWGKGFIVYEAESLSALKDAPEAHTILFDCLSNFAANVLFSPEIFHRWQEKKQAAEWERLSMSQREDIEDDFRTHLADLIMREIRELSLKCNHLVIVSDAVFSDGIVYEQETEMYIHLLGDLWKEIVSEADVVREIVFGLPATVK